MTIQQLKNHFTEQLQEEYPLSEVNSFFNLLAREYLKMNRLQVALNPTKILKEQQQKMFENALYRLQRHEPIQYIIGETNFFGLDFHVNPNVLIPRPETEELVAWILKDLQNEENIFSGKILDIGTGSGCIAISLAKNLSEAQLFAVDISKNALKTAQQNAIENKVQIEWMELDILKTKNLPQKFDIIVSNPPYVRQLEKSEMQRNVLENEPATALYVEDNDPLVFYKKIAELAKKHLVKNGVVYLECNQYLAKETATVFEENGFKIHLEKDIFGNDRMLKGILSNDPTTNNP